MKGNKQTIIEAKNLKKSFRTGDSQQTVFENLDLRLYKGDFTIIMGSSGAGKSTLMYALSGMDRPTAGEQTGKFKVTGFVQSVNLQGELCTLSVAGYESLSEAPVTPVLYVYLRENTDAAAFITHIEERYPDRASGIVNARKLQEEAQSMYMGITLVLTIVIFLVTVLIVLFILYVVIKSLLVRRRQELGIYKAMGYTSSQLIWQTVGSFLPVHMAAIGLSGLAAVFYMPGIYQVIFEALGVMKHSMEVSLSFLMLFAAAEIVLNLMISIMLCMPIRKISAYALIKESGE